MNKDFKKQMHLIENSVAQYLGVSKRTLSDLGWERVDFIMIFQDLGGS